MTPRLPNHRSLYRAATVGLTLVAMTGTMLAQVPAQPQPRDPNMPSQQNTLPEKVEPRSGSPAPADSSGSTGTLSDKLQKSDGVITPPATGAGPVIRPPDTGTTPVIPPPQTAR